jgi:hypothetical protein
MRSLISFARTLSICFAVAVFSTHSVAADPLIRPGDRVALIGGTLIEALQGEGDLEASVILRRPDLRVPFRNLGWSGDDVSGSARRVFGSQPDGYARLMRDLDLASPNVAVIGYGFAEASEGTNNTPTFEAGLRKLAADLSGKQMRLIFLKPFKFPGVLVSDYDNSMQACRDVVEKVATELSAPIIDPLDAINQGGRAAFDNAGLRLSDQGQKLMSLEISAGLLGVDASSLEPSQSQQEDYDQLKAAVKAKDELFFHRHRPMNETYLFLFRKHEQGNNAVEMDQFEQLVQKAEQEIWESR